MSAPSSCLGRLLRLVALAVGAVAAVVVFLNYFAFPASVAVMAGPLLQAVVLLAAAALVLGSFNLLARHVRRLRHQPASAAVVCGFLLAFIGGLAPAGFESGLGRWVSEWLLAPGLAALFALLPIFLAVALYGRLQVRNLAMILFVVGLLLVLLGQAPALAPLLATLRHNLLIGPVAAVFRGVAIGLALGIILAAFARLRQGGER